MKAPPPVPERDDDLRWLVKPVTRQNGSNDICSLFRGGGLSMRTHLFGVAEIHPPKRHTAEVI